MVKTICLSMLLLLCSVSVFSQLEPISYKFTFYKKGSIKPQKHLTVQLIQNRDTLNCTITEDQIIFPKIDSICKVLVTLNRFTYLIEEVDFSKLEPACEVILGYENCFDNFKKISTSQHNLYLIPSKALVLNIDAIESYKEICFISFVKNSAINEKKILNKAYSKFYIH